MAKQAKEYGAHDLAGCVERRRSQATGHLYGLYNCEQSGIDSQSGIDTDLDGPDLTNPWATVCEDHGTIATHRSLAAARHHLPTGDWCEACMAEQQAAKGQPLHVALGDRDEYTCTAQVNGRTFSVQESGGWYWLYREGFRQGRDQYRTPGDACRAAEIDPDAAVWHRQGLTAAE